MGHTCGCALIRPPAQNTLRVAYNVCFEATIALEQIQIAR